MTSYSMFINISCIEVVTYCLCYQDEENSNECEKFCFLMKNRVWNGFTVR